MLGKKSIGTKVHAVEAFPQILGFAEQFQTAKELVQVADRESQDPHRKPCAAEFDETADRTRPVDAAGVSVDRTGDQTALSASSRDPHHVGDVREQSVQRSDRQGDHIGPLGARCLKPWNLKGLGVLAKYRGSRHANQCTRT